MTLIRLTYTSVAAPDLRPDDLRDIVTKAQTNNSRAGVTGFLTYNAPHFTQCLEGRREAVMGVFHRISADPRHRDVRILAEREVDSREFADWHMELIHLDEPTREAVAPVWQSPREQGATRPDSAVEERLIRLVRNQRPRATATPSRLAPARTS
jgi:hypothetical protein